MFFTLADKLQCDRILLSLDAKLKLGLMCLKTMARASSIPYQEKSWEVKDKSRQHRELTKSFFHFSSITACMCSISGLKLLNEQ